MRSKTRKKSEIKRNFLMCLAAVVCIISFIITFADNENIPKWDDIFTFAGVAPQEYEGQDFVRVMDVGQGDSILIHSNGSSVLIDTGTAESENSLCKKISGYGIDEIDSVFTSHLHMDHIGGIKEIIERFSVRNLLMPDISLTAEGAPAARVAVDTVSGNSGGVYTAVQGMYMNVGDFEITVLCYYTDFEDENNRSVVMMAEIDETRFLLMGDAESVVEKRILGEGINVDCDVLKVGHHGSSSSSTDSFIKAASPEYAAISCGLGNQYYHPHSETLGTLEKYGVTTFRTDMDGDITFYVDNNRITAVAENE